MLKIRVGDFRLGPKEKRIINEVLDSGRLSEGAKVNEFEKRWAAFIGTKYCVAVNSGTSALIAGLYALKNLFNIKNGSRVITTPLTFISTVNAIVAAGLEPLFVDIADNSLVADAEEIEKAVSKDSEAAIILPVHLMGYSADMDRINKIAKKHKLVVMEDAAQAHGTVYKGRTLGSLSSLGCFSFYIAHNIQAGEMGAVVTDDREIYCLLKKIKAHGRMCDCPVCMRAKGKCPRINNNSHGEDMDPRFYHDMIGFNFKTMEFQAALGLVQLEKADRILKKRQYNVSYINKGLNSFREILRLPPSGSGISHLAYPIVIKRPDIISRKILRHELEKMGIETRPLFGCIPLQQPAYGYLKRQYEGSLPNAEYAGTNGFYIGCHQYLGKKDLDFIVSSFNKILKGLLWNKK